MNQKSKNTDPQQIGDLMPDLLADISPDIMDISADDGLDHDDADQDYDYVGGIFFSNMSDWCIQTQRYKWLKCEVDKESRRPMCRDSNMIDCCIEYEGHNIASRWDIERKKEAEKQQLLKYVNEVYSDDSYFLNPPKSINSTMELNLAEFPIAMLDKNKTGEKITEYQYSDTIIGRNGDEVKRTWIMKSESKNDKGELVGFGGPKTLQVIYELFQLWREQGFRTSQIYVGTYRQFLLRLGWQTGKSQYDQLKQTIKHIHGLHITGKNCFYIKETDEYLNREMYLFPEMGSLSSSEQKEHPDAKFYIRASEALFETVKKKNMFYFSIDRDFFHKLTPMEQKLGLIISKYFSTYQKPKFMWKRNIFDLANQIPIISKTPFKIRQQLKTVCDSLINKEFKYLSKYTIENNVITFYNSPQNLLDFENKQKVNAKKDKPNNIKKELDSVDYFLDMLKENISHDEKDRPFLILVAKYVPEELIFRFVSTVRQEAENKLKLFTHMVLHEAEKYVRPRLQNAATIYAKKNLSDSDMETIHNDSKPAYIDYLMAKDKREQESDETIYNDPNQLQLNL